MRFLLFVIFVSLFVSEIYGQTKGRAKVRREYRFRTGPTTKWNGMLRPLVTDWNQFLGDDGLDVVDNYLTDGSYNTRYEIREQTNFPALKMFVVRYKPLSQPSRSLSDLIRHNELNDVLNSLSVSSQPYDRMIPTISPNELEKPSPRDSSNLIPGSMVSDRNFRLATLASIGYGQKYRFYR